jgi:YVTN family beta-propeller protein
VRARVGGAETVEGESGCTAGGGMDGGCGGGGGCDGGGEVDPDTGEIVGVSLKNWNARIERKTDVVFGCGMDGGDGGEGGCGGGGEDGMGETEKHLAPGEFDFDVKAFFGDKVNNTVIVIDPIAFEILDTVPTGHLITYTPDHVEGNTKLYISNRGSNAVDIMDQETNEIIGTIPFKHFPRSGETWNTWDELGQVSGMNKPMSTIIDTKTDKIVFSVGTDREVNTRENKNFGGKHACGHPLWLDEKHFVLLDRYNRSTDTYYIERVKGKWGWKLLGSAKTHSSIHQITPRKRSYLGASDLYYGTAEGAEGIYPELIEFRLGIKGLQVNKVLKLVNEERNPNNMYLHHADFHPESTLLYVPSGDGTVFVVDYTRMQVVKTFKAGKGAGHTFFIPQRNYAFVINHKDYFITVADMKTNEKIKDIPVSGLTHLRGKKTLQAHPGYYVSKDWKYFYMFLTEEGAFIRVDLDTLSLAGKIDVGGKPAQGSFVEIMKEGGGHSAGM